MRTFLEKINRFMDLPLRSTPRALLLFAFLLLLPAYFTPLYKMTMFAPQYPDGLRLDIWSYKLDGGNGGQDVKEVNVLNHYIGMRDIDTNAFGEFKWLPFAIGAMGLLFLRTAVLGKMAHLVDVSVMYVYFGLFSLWSFAHKMYVSGHELDPKAAVKVAPFMPPMFGYKQLANFEVHSYPGPGSYSLVLVAVVLVAALYFARRQGASPNGS